MGHHYLPRRLLRGFSSDKLIWTYDLKLKTPPKLLPVARIAQEPGMYPEELEQKLTQAIEQPFDEVLERLEAHEALEVHHIGLVVRYLVNLHRRVPKGRARSVAAAGPVLEQVEAATTARFEALARISPADRELVENNKGRVLEYFERLRGQDNEWLWHDTLMPESLPHLTAALHSMTWECFEVPEGMQLFIGDSPVLLPEEIGLVHHEAEVIFPVSATMALVCTHRPSSAFAYRKLNVQQVRAINRMTVFRAQRWIFFRAFENWIVPFCDRIGRSA